MYSMTGKYIFATNHHKKRTALFFMVNIQCTANVDKLLLTSVTSANFRVEFLLSRLKKAREV